MRVTHDAKGVATIEFEVGDAVQVHAMGSWYGGEVVKVGRTKVTVRYKSGAGVTRDKAQDPILVVPAYTFVDVGRMDEGRAREASLRETGRAGWIWLAYTGADDVEAVKDERRLPPGARAHAWELRDRGDCRDLFALVSFGRVLE